MTVISPIDCSNEDQAGTEKFIEVEKSHVKEVVGENTTSSQNYFKDF